METTTPTLAACTSALPPGGAAAGLGAALRPSGVAPHCATCAHFTRPADDRLMAVSAFGRCAKMEAGRYVSPEPRFGCRFDLPQWVRRA
ncbi:hypothetical protein [Pseudothauera rhizosphaerae]|uniref:Uncharacterized protein n=1 Tax=Pseudothauera rhizosphaerae TaxID=2565932 RepID=A0A4S4AMR7_9RHOO|nr:hypothetical protein [Pseudothauera rhizosphaerae]THF60923.1 hypothetical protein E6O51_11890 [Pseudothauera rhizosphaerae]